MTEQNTGDWGGKLSISSRTPEFPVVATVCCAIVLIVGCLVAIGFYNRHQTTIPSEVAQTGIDLAKSLVVTSEQKIPTLAAADTPPPAAGPSNSNHLDTDAIFREFSAYKAGMEAASANLRHQQSR